MPNGQKTTPRYKEAEGKQKVAQIYILDNTFYLLIVLCSHLRWVKLLASLWCGYGILNCFIGYKIACIVKFLALKAVFPKQSLLKIFVLVFLGQHVRTKNLVSFLLHFCNLYMSGSKGLLRVGFRIWIPAGISELYQFAYWYSFQRLAAS